MFALQNIFVKAAFSQIAGWFKLEFLLDVHKMEVGRSQNGSSLFQEAPSYNEQHYFAFICT
jgi:hypothetical protein